MGVAKSIMGYFTGPDESVVDPALGLTLRQKRLLVESWEVLGSKTGKKKHGVSLFLHLFRSYPSQREFFPLFKDMEEDEMKRSPQLRAHAVTLMHQIATFIESLEDDTECLVGLVEKVARNHIKRGIGFKEFEELRNMFGPFLEDELGSAATDEVKVAWDKFLGVMNSVVKAMEDKEDQSKD